MKVTPFRISMIFTALAIFSYITGFSFFETMELKSLDMRFVTRGPKAPGQEVVIITIDEKSLDHYGRWPWPRKRIAELIDSLTHYGVKSIGFDIVFAEPDHNAQSIEIVEIKNKLDSLAIKNSELDLFLESKIRENDNDSILAEAIKRSGRVVLGYFFHFSDSDLKHIDKSKIREDKELNRSSYSLVQHMTEEARSVDFASTAYSVESNIEKFSKEAAGFGYFNVLPDEDGTVRWAALIMRYKDKYFPPLSLQLARNYLDDKGLKIVVDEFGVQSIVLGGRDIPTDEDGNLLINYRGVNKTFPHYSIYDVITGKVPGEKLKDKIALIGPTAIGIYDMRVTPFSGVFPGVEIHANIIDNIVHGDFLYRPEWIGMVDLVIILLIGILLGLLLPRLGPLAGALFTVAVFLLFTSGNFYAFVNEGVWLNYVYPAISIITIYTSITLYYYMTEEREKKKVKNAFQYYMTSSVVNEVLKDPEKLKLGGDKKVLSVLFSDIRNFTTISEQMSPESLVQFLNEYLTVMTDIVFRHDGVLDKYMGDAIMSIYGAPMDQADHPLRACKTALEMMQALKKLHLVWEERGLPKMNIGIGISTGPMVVGNMGSERRFDFTVMGDTVNLGSRLEAINKVYGTNVIISEDTYDGVRNEMVCRELDLVKVKGKERPAKIYELMAEKGRDGRYEKLAAGFGLALGLYREMKWDDAISAFQKVFEIRPNDLTSKMYIKRCRTLAQSPPPSDWNGVFKMTTK